MSKVLSHSIEFGLIINKMKQDITLIAHYQWFAMDFALKERAFDTYRTYNFYMQE